MKNNFFKTKPVAYNIINESRAFENWGERLKACVNLDFQGQYTKHLNEDRHSKMTFLAANKYRVDGPVNASEKKLLESYGAATTETQNGFGPVTFPQNPGEDATSAVWNDPNYETGSGDIPSAIFGLAMNVAAYTVGFDLCTMVPVELPSGMYSFLNHIYTGGRRDVAGEAPVYIVLAADEIKFGFDYSVFTPGDDIFITQDGVADGLAIHGIFYKTTRRKGDIIIKVVDTGSIALNVYTPDDANSVDAVMTNIGANAELAPGTSPTAVDNVNAQQITNPYVYQPSALDEFIEGYGHSDALTHDPMNRDTFEKGTQNEFELELFTKAYEIGGDEVHGKVSKVQLKDLKAYGINALAQIYKQLQNELIQRINNNIINRIFRLGVLNHANLKNAQGVDLNLFVADAGTPSKDLADFGVAEFVDPLGNDRTAEFTAVPNAENNSSSENDATRQRKIVTRILAAKDLLATVGRYGEGDFAVVNTQIATALKDVKGYVAAPYDNSIGRTGDLHMIGMIDNCRIYKNPHMKYNDTRVAVGIKGNEDTPGVKFLAYDLAESVEIVPEQTLGAKVAVWSRYQLIDAGFHPESMYITFALSNDYGLWV